MTTSKKRVGRSLRLKNRNMKRRIWPWMVSPRMEKEKVSKVVMRGKPPSHGRRRT